MSDDWREFALCRETDPAAFFPEPSASAEPARRVCSRCTVTRLCLDAALSVPAAQDQDGIWAGTTPKQRAALRTQARKAARVAALPTPPVRCDGQEAA